jgi:2-keto-4-pentenoate hydratase/2-oxohepta-3-ene-1,7-dioic acid hydratase in catechol pathway
VDGCVAISISEHKLLQGAHMKLAFFDNYKLGLVVGDKIVDVSAVVKGIKALGPQDVMRGVIEQFPKLKGKLAAAAKKGKGKPLSKVKLQPPLPKPDNIVCMAVNYMEDGTLPAPAPINAFVKTPNSIIGDGDTMVLPDMAASVFEGEAELAVVIGKKAKGVKAKDAMKYIFGYTNFIDGSARGVVPPTNVFFQMKSRDTFAPIGPYIVTADEIKNVNKMQITLKNNGVVMQNFNTDDMAHNIPRCIEWITSIHTLMPGDIVATGTNHRGLNPFMDGDKIELTCAGCGTLHIKIKDPLKRKWARITRLKHKESGAEGVHTPQIGGKYTPAAK